MRSYLYFSSLFLGLLLLLPHTYGQSLTYQSQVLASTPNSGNNDYFENITRQGSADVHRVSGKLVVVFEDPDAAGSLNKDIYCKIYNQDMTLDGSISVNPFRINSTVTNDQTHAVVKVNQADNSFLVAWSSKHNGTDYEILARKFSLSTGLALSGEVAVNTANSADQVSPKIAFDYVHNHAVVLYQDMGGQDGGSPSGSAGSLARIVSCGTMTVSGAQFCVTQAVSSSQYLSDIAISPVSGEMIVLYYSNHISANGYDVYRGNYDYNESTNSYQYSSHTRINNSAVSDQSYGSLAVNERTGDYVVAWVSSDAGSSYNAYAKIFSRNHLLLQDDFLIHSNTTYNQHVPQVVWNEESNSLICFFYFSGSTCSNVQYRIFDRSRTTGKYIPAGMEADALGGACTAKSFVGSYIPVSYVTDVHKIYLVYDIYNNYTITSKTNIRLFTYVHPSFSVPAPVADQQRNYVHTKVFDTTGTVIRESRVYIDNLGRTIQSQQKVITGNAASDRILAQMVVYDKFGRPALQTLPGTANTGSNAFGYDPSFFTSQLQYGSGVNAYHPAYSYKDFDLSASSQPAAVYSGSSLGTYYSNGNSDESKVAVSGWPFYQRDYNDAVEGGTERSSRPGDRLRTGSGHESGAVVMPALKELNHYLSLKNAYFVPGNLSLDYEAVKVISKDENGKEAISFRDKSGQVIASCMSDLTAAAFANTATIRPAYSWVTLTVPSGSRFSRVSVESQGTIRIFEITGGVETQVWDGFAYNLPSTYSEIPAGKTYKFVSNKPFNIVYGVYMILGSGEIFSRQKAESNNMNITANAVDRHLQTGHGLSLAENNASGSVVAVTNLETGALVYRGTIAGLSTSTVPAGYYRIRYESAASVVNYSPGGNPFIVVSTQVYYGNFSYSFYDLAGRLVAQTAPKGVNRSSTASPKFTSTYTYNTLGWLLSSGDPDRGLTEYVYKKDGSLRFSQNAVQRAAYKFSYIHYDGLARVTETGEYTGDVPGTGKLVFQNMKDRYNNVAINVNDVNVHTILENSDGVDDARCNTVSWLVYDDADAGLPGKRTGYTQRNIQGRVSKSLNANNTYWYSYDERGRLEWTVQELTGSTGSAFSATAANRIKTANYSYGFYGNLKKVIYQKDVAGERFDHLYSYDPMLRVKQVETSMDGTTFLPQTKYSYYLHGPLKRKELGGDLQGLDYVYTVDGMLKAINHPDLDSKDPGGDGYANSFKKDIFGMVLEYYDNDYVRSNTSYQTSTNLGASGISEFFNGNIRSCTWNTQTAPGSPSPVPAQYAYKYDGKYQLTDALFGTHSYSSNQFTDNATATTNANAYRVNGIGYDLNGNLTALRRKDNTGATSSKDYIDYQYHADRNSLYRTRDGSAQVTREYYYDAAGQMTVHKDKVGNKHKYFRYDYSGKVTGVYKDSLMTAQPLVTFLYDEKGYRIRKTQYSATFAPLMHVWYINDASGNVLSVYETNVSTSTTGQKELYVYGSERIAILDKRGTPEYRYEVKDHLGNVRATIRKYNGNLEVMSANDFYPHGGRLSQRGSIGANAEHCYQGEWALTDEETELVNFSSRMYDPEIGRWSAPDPMYQFASPYLAMANDPIRCIDKDGEWVVQVAGTLMGAGAVVFDLWINDQLKDGLSGAELGRIGLGAATGFMLTVAPAAGAKLFGGGILTEAVAASTITAASSILDQGIQGNDMTSGKVIGGAVLEGVVGGTIGGLVGKFFSAPAGRAATRQAYRFVPSEYANVSGMGKSAFLEQLRKNPGAITAAVNAAVDVTSNIIKYTTYGAPTNSIGNDQIGGFGNGGVNMNMASNGMNNNPGGMGMPNAVQNLSGEPGNYRILDRFVAMEVIIGGKTMPSNRREVFDRSSGDKVYDSWNLSGTNNPYGFGNNGGAHANPVNGWNSGSVNNSTNNGTNNGNNGENHSGAHANY